MLQTSLASLIDVLTLNGALYIGVAIVIAGIIIGLKDVARYSFKRSWAISSVNFTESIRRRVLLITPLAILGVIIVSQLQRPIDEADAIRQTIKFCLFATGTVVTIVTIILACTNLPKEIDNRVIYTIVTKPTTRLEIVLGKIVGFVRVSATILLIMGVFTFAYAEARAAQLVANARARLQTLPPTDASRPTLAH